ncbi:hypothetical protein [Algoriphagus boritolerans]|uniref:hypothetical protein n=1 Tax=Algoriphagus boritolerans TaxID=308111 RepID=UPI002FCE283D
MLLGNAPLWIPRNCKLRESLSSPHALISNLSRLRSFGQSSTNTMKIGKKTMRQLSDLGKDMESVSEEEAKSRIQKRFQYQAQLLENEKAFVSDISKVLSSKQILMLNNIARDFNRQLYQRGRGGN